MKKNLLWLFPLLAIALALMFFLPGHEEKEADPSPAKMGVTERPPRPDDAPGNAGTLPPLESVSPPPPSSEAPVEPAPRAAVTESGRAIRGRVRWKGAPGLPPGLEIHAKTGAKVEGKNEFPGTIDPDGSFSIPVPEKLFLAFVAAEGDFHFSERVEARLDEAKSFPEIELTLNAAGKVQGTVLKPDRSPAADAKVLLGLPMDATMWVGQEYEGAKPRSAKTDSQGRFVFRAVVSGKDRLLRASLSGFGPVTQENLTVQPLQTLEAELSLAPESSVSGKIVDAQGLPVEGVKVKGISWSGMGELMQQSVLQSETEGEMTASSAADGSFRIGGLRSGKYRLSASKKGFEATIGETISLGAGETKDGVILTLGKGLSITGKVVNAKSEPVAGAKIKIMPDWMSGEGSMSAQFTGEVEQETESDAEGNFRVAGLGKGLFVVEAEHEPEGEARRDRVRPGEKTIEMRLQPQGSVRGRVTAAGIGAAISKYKIRATKQEGWMPKAVETERVKNKDGIYELKGLPAGSLALTVTAEGFAAASQSVEVRSGETLEGIDFALFPAATVRGKVIASGSGAPVEGAQIGVSSTGNPFAWVQERMDRDRPQAKSDGEGAFELTGLAAGKLTLQATHPDFAVGNSEPFDLGAGETIEGLVVSLSGGGGIDGFVFDEDGLAVSGASVFATGLKSGTIKNGRTDASGYFSFEKGLAPGQYQVTSMSSVPESAEEEDMGAQFLQGMKTTFAQVEEGKVARILLGTKKEGGCRVTGRVLSGGKPVSGAYVSLLPKARAASPKETEQVQEGQELTFGMTDKNGEFALASVPPGEQSFSVQKGSFGGASVIHKIDIPFASEHRVEFTLPGGRIAGRITDRRTGEPVADLWVTVSPSLDGHDPNWLGSGFGQAQTNSEGNYSIENMKGGKYSISAGNAAFFPQGGERPSYGRATKTVVLGEGQDLRDADFALGPAIKVTGRVMAAGTKGETIQGASIYFQDASGQTLGSFSPVQSDAAGNFTCMDLGAGSYTVFAQATGFVSSSQSLHLEEGGNTNLLFFLKTGTQVTVKVTSQEGKGLEGATFQVFDGKGAPVLSFTGVEEMMAAWAGNREEGTYALGNMAPGIYRVIVNKDGKTILDTTVSIEAIPSQTIELKSSQ